MAASPMRWLEANVSLFSAAETRVALLCVGEASPAVFDKYASLITRHRQVELSSIKSFYKEAQKSPFKFFPWRTGHMSFSFLEEEEALTPSPLSPLHSHRAVAGVIGVLHCPSVPDVARAVAQFEKVCRIFKGASTVRLAAFGPSDSQMADLAKKDNIFLFPPSVEEEDELAEGLENRPPVEESRGSLSVTPPSTPPAARAARSAPSVLEQHAEIMMTDFAACVLTELERWMLVASPTMVDLGALEAVDAQGSVPGAGAPGPSPEAAARAAPEDEFKTKRRYGRLQKQQGDRCLLAGSPLDAQGHYATASDLCRGCGDLLFLAAALEGQAAARALQEAAQRGVGRQNPRSIFSAGEGRAGSRHAKKERRSEGAASERSLDAERSQPGINWEARPAPESSADTPPAGPDRSGASSPGASSSDDGSAAEASLPVHARRAFWALLRGSPALAEARALCHEARSTLRRRGGALPCLVEAELRLAALEAGALGPGARGAVAEAAGAALALAEGLRCAEDRLLVEVEAARLLGRAGLGRRRSLLLWSAAENARALGLASHALVEEPLRVLAQLGGAAEAGKAGGAGEGDREVVFPSESDAQRSSLWPAVRAGCLESALGLCIQARRHAGAWEAASALLRSHGEELPAQRQQSLLECLAAASSHVAAGEKARAGGGPPPLLCFRRACALGPRKTPAAFGAVAADAAPGYAGGALSPSAAKPLFLYDPYAQPQAGGAPNEQAALPVWVAGETAAVELEVSNPTSVGVFVDKLTLEAEWAGDPDCAPRLPSGELAPVWTTKAVNLKVPPGTRPVSVQVRGTPLVAGPIRFRGCRLVAFGGMVWHQPWERAQERFGALLMRGNGGRSEDQGRGRGEDQKPPDAARPSHAPLPVPSPSPFPPAVLVAPPLPRVEHELRSLEHASAALVLRPLPADGSAEPRYALTMLAGQVQALVLHLSCVSGPPAAAARLEVRSQAGRVAGGAPRGVLEHCMPLRPGPSKTQPGRASLPVFLAAQAPRGGGGGGRAHDVVECALSVAGEEVKGEEEEPSGRRVRLGRRLSSRVELSVLPSLSADGVSLYASWAGGRACNQDLALRPDVHLAVEVDEGAVAGPGLGHIRARFGCEEGLVGEEMHAGEASNLVRSPRKQCTFQVHLHNRCGLALQAWVGPAMGAGAPLAALREPEIQRRLTPAALREDEGRAGGERGMGEARAAEESGARGDGAVTGRLSSSPGRWQPALLGPGQSGWASATLRLDARLAEALAQAAEAGAATPLAAPPGAGPVERLRFTAAGALAEGLALYFRLADQAMPGPSGCIPLNPTSLHAALTPSALCALLPCQAGAAVRPASAREPQALWLGQSGFATESCEAPGLRRVVAWPCRPAQAVELELALRNDGPGRLTVQGEVVDRHLSREGDGGWGHHVAWTGKVQDLSFTLQPGEWRTHRVRLRALTPGVFQISFADVVCVSDPDLPPPLFDVEPCYLLCSEESA